MKKTKYIILIILTCILSIFLYNNYNNIKEYILHVNRVDTVYHSDTIYKDTTLYIIKEKPVPKYIEIVKTDTFYKEDGTDTILKTELTTLIDMVRKKELAFTPGIIKEYNIMYNEMK